MPHEVTAIGNINIDIILKIDEYPEIDEKAIAKQGHVSCGGSAANFSIALAKQRIKTKLIACVGDDAFSKIALSELKKARVNIKDIIVKNGEITGQVIIVTDRNMKQRMFANKGANVFLEQIKPDRNILSKSKLIHMTGIPQALIQYVSRISVADAILLSYDPGRSASSDNVKSVLKYLDFLFVNEREFETYLGKAPNEENVRLIAKTFPGIVILKQGKRGAIASDGIKIYKTNAFNVKVADPTGAGDSFAAGFIASWINNDDIEEALVNGAATAAMVIQKIGAHEGTPTPEQITQFLEKYNQDN